MNYCRELLAMGLEPDCLANPKGYLAEGIIINWDDVEWPLNSSNFGNGAIASLPLKSGKKGYLLKQLGIQPFNGTTVTLNAPTNNMPGTATSAVSFRVPQNSPAITSGFIDKMMNGRFIVILRQPIVSERYINGNVPDASESGFPIFGLFQGLRLSEGSLDRYSDDTGGGWTLTLTESESPMSGVFLGPDYDTGQAVWDSLLTEASAVADGE